MYSSFIYKCKCWIHKTLRTASSPNFSTFSRRRNTKKVYIEDAISIIFLSHAQGYTHILVWTWYELQTCRNAQTPRENNSKCVKAFNQHECSLRWHTGISLEVCCRQCAHHTCVKRYAQILSAINSSRTRTSTGITANIRQRMWVHGTSNTRTQNTQRWA